MLQRVFFLLLVIACEDRASAGTPRGARIVNGVPAQAHEFPSQVSMQKITTHNCGASILNKYWALTAAHCITWPTPMIIRSGTSDLQNGGSYHFVVYYVIHERYDASNSFNNDIAVVKVFPPFLIDGVAVRAAQLPGPDQQVADGSVATAVGWGRFALGSAIRTRLFKVDVRITNQQSCREQYKNYENHYVYDTMICAEDPDHLKGVCEGDSGGPLMVGGQVVGVVSWGYYGCAHVGYSGVYTRVASYRRWIWNHTGV